MWARDNRASIDLDKKSKKFTCVQNYGIARNIAATVSRVVKVDYCIICHCHGAIRAAGGQQHLCPMSRREEQKGRAVG